MVLDFYHNKIVSDTISERFIASFTENLIPKLEERFGGSLLGVQMYEDFISDRLVLSGYAYYPLTVILDSGFEVVWIRWSFENEADFKGGIPYSYLGEAPLCFEILDGAPSAFASVTLGRRMYFDASSLPIHINTVIDSVKLSGKYSQTFLDELSVGVCREIEKAMAVSGLVGTGIRLEIPFAPETYMEHTSENVTYRRILISDKTSSAKDLWIKWTRLDSTVGFSVCDTVSESNIVFELGEDVPQKVREKEYRFLTRISATKYQTAMGRKNVTEWRELIKRALKRGELVRRELPSENEQKTGEMNDELDRILQKIGYTAPTAPKAEPTPETPDDELLRAIQLAEMTVMGSSDEPEAEASGEEIFFMPEGVSLEIEKSEDEDTEATEDEDALPWESSEGPLVLEAESDCEVVEADESEFGEEEKNILDELLKLDTDEEAFDIEEENEESEEDEEEIPEPSEIFVEVVDAPSDDDEPDESEEEDEEPMASLDRLSKLLSDDLLFDKVEEDTASGEEPEESCVTEEDVGEDMDPRGEQKALSDILAGKIELVNSLRLRIEEEIEKRKAIEYELSAALREREQLSAERDRINALYENALAERLKNDELYKAERERLVGEIAALKAADERERYRLAEAAKLEIEERRRAAEEAERAELARRRLAEEQKRQLEIERFEAEREAERVRIQNELGAAPKKPTVLPENTVYTAYAVKLLFRHSVDPNSINRIGELIKTTVAYYKKEDLKIFVKATMPDSMTVQLDFTNIPDNEHELIVNIIKVLGNSNLGIAKAILD